MSTNMHYLKRTPDHVIIVTFYFEEGFVGKVIMYQRQAGTFQHSFTEIFLQTLVLNFWMVWTHSSIKSRKVFSADPLALRSSSSICKEIIRVYELNNGYKTMCFIESSKLRITDFSSTVPKYHFESKFVGQSITHGLNTFFVSQYNVHFSHGVFRVLLTALS